MRTQRGDMRRAGVGGSGLSGMATETSTVYAVDTCTVKLTGNTTQRYILGLICLIGGQICTVNKVWYDGTYTFVQFGANKIPSSGIVSLQYDASTSYYCTFPGYSPSYWYHFENAAKTFYDSSPNAKDQDAPGVYIRGTIGSRAAGGKFGSYGFNSPSGCISGLFSYNNPSWCCRAYIKPTDASSMYLMYVLDLPGGDNYDIIGLSVSTASAYMTFRCDDQGTGNNNIAGAANTGLILNAMNEVVWGRNAGVWTIVVNGNPLIAAVAYNWSHLQNNVPASVATPLLGSYYCSAQISKYVWAGVPSSYVVDEVLVWPTTFPPLSLISNQLGIFGPDAR